MYRITILAVIILGSHLTANAQKTLDEMKTIVDQAKLSCKLTTPELQERKKTLIADLKEKMLEKIETDRGFKYRFEGSDKMLDLLNSFIKTERLCCDFFTFNLVIASESESVWLELSGPEGIKEFIKHEIEF